MRSSSVLAALLVPILAVGCSMMGNATENVADDPLRIAAGPDAESALLAHTVVHLLAAADMPAQVVNFSDALDTRRALELGAVDIRPAYTGETWLETLGRPDPPGDPLDSFRAVRDHDLDDDIVWLRPRFEEGIDAPPADATFAFVVAGLPSIDADLVTVSQLASRLSERPDAALCVDEEFARRADGLRMVLAAYSVRSDQPVLTANPTDAVHGVLAGDCLAGLTTATHGEAWRFGLRPLVDDLEVFPAFVVLPQVARDVLLGRPGLRHALTPMPAELTTALLGAANARVVGGEPIDEIAEGLAATLLARAGREPQTTPARLQG